MLPPMYVPRYPISLPPLSSRWQLFGSMLMNTAFIVILIAGNLDFFTNGRSGPEKRALSAAQLMSGTISDLTADWYLQV